MVRLGDMLKDRNISFLALLLSLFALSFFSIVSSLAINVYFHELGHYAVAEYYGLDPEMHIDNVVEVDGTGVRMNISPEAYVRYKDPGNTWENIFITISGPFVNGLIFIVVIIIQIITHNNLQRKVMKARKSGRRSLETRYLRLCLLTDILLMSMALPSLLSAVMNLMNHPGSDGAYLRELLRGL